MIEAGDWLVYTHRIMSISNIMYNNRNKFYNIKKLVVDLMSSQAAVG